MSKNIKKQSHNIQSEKRDFYESSVFPNNKKFENLSRTVSTTEFYDDYEEKVGEDWEPFNTLSLPEQKQMEKDMMNLESLIKSDSIEKRKEIISSFPKSIQKKYEESMLRFETELSNRESIQTHYSDKYLQVDQSHFHEEVPIPYEIIRNQMEMSSIQYFMIKNEKENKYLLNLTSHECMEELFLPKIRKQNSIIFTLESLKKELNEKCDDLTIFSIDYNQNSNRFLICGRMDDVQDLMFVCFVCIIYETKKKNTSASSIPVFFAKKPRMLINTDLKEFQKISNIHFELDYYFYFTCGCGK